LEAKAEPLLKLKAERKRPGSARAVSALLEAVLPSAEQQVTMQRMMAVQAA
jgi:hypothetical protein